MDFFDMNFSTLFLEKHGKDKFDKIVKQIMQENSNEYDNNFIEILFKVAYLEFFGLDSSTIDKMLKDLMRSSS